MPTGPRYHLRSTMHSKYTDGNFEVITADNVTFRVNDYHLFTNSPVFREARCLKSDVETAPGVIYTVQLVDNDFETASVFETVIDIIISSNPDELFNKLTPTTESVIFYQKVNRFLNKWMIVRPRNDLLRSVKLYTGGERGSIAMVVFVIAADTGDTDLCRAAIGSSTKSTQAFAPTNYADWVWEHCPPRYLSALIKSWVTVSRGYKGATILYQFNEYFKNDKTFDDDNQ